MATDYPFETIISRARQGRESIYPYKDDTSRFSVFGSDIYTKKRRFHTLDDILLTAPQFTPHRLEKANDLIFREPFFRDVDLTTEIGGFKTTMPLIQASMGSPEDWNIVAPYSAEACGKRGLIYGIGENVAGTWGYDTSKVRNQPSFLDRVLSYFEHRKTGFGGIVIQQNEEDAQNELWNKVYSDKRLTKYIQQGLIAFEIKGGQGAKSGIGGEKIVNRETAMRLQDKGYIIHPDPKEVEQETYERHSSPDMFTDEILKNRILKLRNDYPRAKIWLKTGPYRDLHKVIKVATDAGIDVISIDGKEGGTGMSPTVALQHLGLPTLACLKIVKDVRQEGIKTSIIISGRITDGSQIVKSLAFGADAVAMGRPFLIAANAYPFSKLFVGKEFYKFRWLKKLARLIFSPGPQSVNYIQNFVKTIQLEVQLLVSSLGKYDLDKIAVEDIMTTDLKLSHSLNIPSVFGKILNQSYEVGDELFPIKAGIIK